MLCIKSSVTNLQKQMPVLSNVVVRWMCKIVTGKLYSYRDYNNTSEEREHHKSK